jgi:hypothetical protein
MMVERRKREEGEENNRRVFSDYQEQLEGSRFNRGWYG